MKRRTATGIFMKGLFATLPVVASVYLVIWMFQKVDRLAIDFFPEQAQIPGFGILLFLILIFVVGLLVSSPLTSPFYRWLEWPLKKLPLLKVFYTGIQDLLNYFNMDGSNKPSQVVVVQPTDGGMRFVGLLTSDASRGLPRALSDGDYVAVYVPVSYQIGGYTVFVPRTWIKPLDMRVETAMKSALTGWIPHARSDDESNQVSKLNNDDSK